MSPALLWLKSFWMIVPQCTRMTKNDLFWGLYNPVYLNQIYLSMQPAAGLQELICTLHLPNLSSKAIIFLISNNFFISRVLTKSNILDNYETIWPLQKFSFHLMTFCHLLINVIICTSVLNISDDVYPSPQYSCMEVVSERKEKLLFLCKFLKGFTFRPFEIER